MLIIVVIGLSVFLSVFYLKPFTKTPEQRIKFLKLYLLIIPFAIIGYWLVTYLAKFDEPNSFSSSVDALKQRSDIKNKIGSYESYSYFDKDIPKETDNPAKFKLSIKGSKATVYLTCEAIKNKSGEWHLTKITQDSLINHR